MKLSNRGQLWLLLMQHQLLCPCACYTVLTEHTLGHQKGSNNLARQNTCSGISTAAPSQLPQPYLVRHLGCKWRL